MMREFQFSHSMMASWIGAHRTAPELSRTLKWHDDDGDGDLQGALSFWYRARARSELAKILRDGDRSFILGYEEGHIGSFRGAEGCKRSCLLSSVLFYCWTKYRWPTASIRRGGTTQKNSEEVNNNDTLWAFHKQKKKTRERNWVVCKTTVF